MAMELQGLLTSREDGIVNQHRRAFTCRALHHEMRLPQRFRWIAHGEQDDNADTRDRGR